MPTGRTSEWSYCCQTWLKASTPPPGLTCCRRMDISSACRRAVGAMGTRKSSWSSGVRCTAGTGRRSVESTAPLNQCYKLSGTLTIITAIRSVSLVETNRPVYKVGYFRVVFRCTRLYGPGNASPCYERCPSSWRSCCYQIFKVLRLCRYSTDRYETFTHVIDNILHRATVADFWLRS